jgi:hypothetical protein
MGTTRKLTIFCPRMFADVFTFDVNMDGYWAGWQGTAD